MACLFPSTQDAFSQLSCTVLGIDLAAAMMNAETRHTHRKAWIRWCSACPDGDAKAAAGNSACLFYLSGLEKPVYCNHLNQEEGLANLGRGLCRRGLCRRGLRL